MLREGEIAFVEFVLLALAEVAGRKLDVHALDPAGEGEGRIVVLGYRRPRVHAHVEGVDAEAARDGHVDTALADFLVVDQQHGLAALAKTVAVVGEGQFDGGLALRKRLARHHGQALLVEVVIE